jgi:hypothetical protein
MPFSLARRRDRGDQGRGGGVDAEHGLELDQGLVDGEIGRNDAQGRVTLRDFDFLVEQTAEVLQTRQIGVRVSLGLDDVLVIEEVRQVLVGAGQLRDDIGRAAVGAVVGEAGVERLAVGQDELDGVVAGRVHAGELAAINRAHGLELGGVVLGVLLKGGEGEVRQLRLGPGHVAGVDAQAGGRLGRAAQLAGDHAVIEGVGLGGFGRIAARGGGEDVLRRYSGGDGGDGRGGEQEVTAILHGQALPGAEIVGARGRPAATLRQL